MSSRVFGTHSDLYPVDLDGNRALVNIRGDGDAQQQSTSGLQHNRRRQTKERGQFLDAQSDIAQFYLVAPAERDIERVELNIVRVQQARVDERVAKESFLEVRGQKDGHDGGGQAQNVAGRQSCSGSMS